MLFRTSVLVLALFCSLPHMVNATEVAHQENYKTKALNFIKNNPGKIVWSTILVMDAIAILAQPTDIKIRAYGFGMGMLPSDPPSTFPGIAGFITFCCMGVTGIYYIAELRDRARKNRKLKQEMANSLALHKELAREILNQNKI